MLIKVVGTIICCCILTEEWMVANFLTWNNSITHKWLHCTLLMQRCCVHSKVHFSVYTHWNALHCVYTLKCTLWCTWCWTSNCVECMCGVQAIKIHDANSHCYKLTRLHQVHVKWLSSIIYQHLKLCFCQRYSCNASTNVKYMGVQSWSGYKMQGLFAKLHISAKSKVYCCVVARY